MTRAFRETCSSLRKVHMQQISAGEMLAASADLFGWTFEMLSNAAPVPHPCANSAVRLLLKELFICEGANISAPLTTVYLGGPRLAPDLGLSGIAVFDPLPAVNLFSGCGPLHPQIQHMDLAFEGEVQRTRKVGFHFPEVQASAKCAGFCCHPAVRRSASTPTQLAFARRGASPHVQLSTFTLTLSERRTRISVVSQ